MSVARRINAARLTCPTRNRPIVKPRRAEQWASEAKKFFQAPRKPSQECSLGVHFSLADLKQNDQCRRSRFLVSQMSVSTKVQKDICTAVRRNVLLRSKARHQFPLPRHWQSKHHTMWGDYRTTLIASISTADPTNPLRCWYSSSERIRGCHPLF